MMLFSFAASMIPCGGARTAHGIRGSVHHQRRNRDGWIGLSKRHQDAGDPVVCVLLDTGKADSNVALRQRSLFQPTTSGWIFSKKKTSLNPATRSDLLSNRMVLVAPSDSPLKLEILSGFDLSGALGENRLAMGDPAHVPAGIYGKQALETLGVWDSVKNRIAPAKDVRSALVLVERGEDPFGDRLCHGCGHFRQGSNCRGISGKHAPAHRVSGCPGGRK